jgi:hypothetical protein
MTVYYGCITHKRRPWEGGGRDWSAIAACEGTPMIARNYQKLEKRHGFWKEPTSLTP